MFRIARSKLSGCAPVLDFWYIGSSLRAGWGMHIVSVRFLLCAVTVVTACAQTSGDISGLVRDPSGGAVAAAVVKATNVSTNATRVSVTTDAGLFSFPSLPPGTYSVAVEKAGFKSASGQVELQVQQSRRLDFDLELGQVTESVNVSAAVSMLESENATVGTVIDNRRIVELPLNGRNYLQLVALAPNVSYGFPFAGQADSRQGGVRAQQSISVAGMRSQYNRYTLDGVENTDPNFNTFVVFPSIDALQEFKVQSGVYPAEFGRGATQINVSTKPGTNDYHGTAFYFLRNDKLDAKNYAFTSARPPKDPFKWNQFGFTLGGPISIPKIINGRNRLFFMTNYEWFRQRRAIQAVSSLASAAMRGGDFSALPQGTQGIFDPRTRVRQGDVVTAQPFPGNIIPADAHPSDFPAPSRVLPRPECTGRRPPEQLRAGAGPADRPRPVRGAVRRGGIVEVPVVRAVQLGGRESAHRKSAPERRQDHHQFQAGDGQQYASFHAVHGQRVPFRLHQVLQHDRTAARLHGRRGGRFGHSRPEFRAARAMGHSERHLPGRLPGFRQRLRRTIREHQFFPPVRRQLFLDSRQAFLQVRRRDPAGSVQPGRQPVRARAVHLYAQRHQQPGRERYHGRPVRRFSTRRDLPGRSGRIDRASAVPLDRVRPVCRR